MLEGFLEPFLVQISTQEITHGGAETIPGVSCFVSLTEPAAPHRIGETPLEYYGQYSTLYSANVKVRNILLDERRTLGRGWSRKVDFTTLNATEKAREAIYPYLREFTASLSEFKDRG